MHQTNFSKGAWNLKLWMSWSRSQAPYCMSKYLDKFLDSWNNTIEGPLKVLCYKNMWSTWMQHNLSLAMTTKGWE